MLKKRTHAEMTAGANIDKLRNMLDRMSTAAATMSSTADYSLRSTVRCMHLSLATGIVRAREDAQTVLDALTNTSNVAQKRALRAFESACKQVAAQKEETSAGSKYARAMTAACDAALETTLCARSWLRGTPVALPVHVSPCVSAYISMRLLEGVRTQLEHYMAAVHTVPVQAHVMVAGEGTRFYKAAPCENLLRLKLCTDLGSDQSSAATFSWLDRIWMEAAWVTADCVDLDMHAVDGRDAADDDGTAIVDARQRSCVDALQTLRLCSAPVHECTIAVAYTVADPPCAAASHISVRIGTYVGNGGTRPHEFARFFVRPLFNALNSAMRCVHALAVKADVISFAVNASTNALALVHPDCVSVYTLPAFKHVRDFVRTEGRDQRFRAACFAARDVLYVLSSDSLFRTTWGSDVLVRTHTFATKLTYVAAHGQAAVSHPQLAREAVALAIHNDHLAISFEHKTTALFSLASINGTTGQLQQRHALRVIGLPSVSRDSTAANCLCFSPSGTKLLMRTTHSVLAQGKAAPAKIAEVAVAPTNDEVTLPPITTLPFVDVTYDHDGNILVLHRETRQVQVFAGNKPEAHLIAEWPLPTKDARAIKVAGASAFILTQNRLMMFA